jgi:hypothetical protein
MVALARMSAASAEIVVQSIWIEMICAHVVPLFGGDSALQVSCRKMAAREPAIAT